MIYLSLAISPVLVAADFVELPAGGLDDVESGLDQMHESALENQPMSHRDFALLENLPCLKE